MAAACRRLTGLRVFIRSLSKGARFLDIYRQNLPIFGLSIHYSHKSDTKLSIACIRKQRRYFAS